MCGIAGFYATDGRMGDRALLQRMTDAIAHRGPDGEGHYLDGPVGLGHRRLSIIDPTPGSDQPFFSADGRHVIIFNGEIYNFAELKAELERAGETFRTTGDTEVVLTGFRVWGPEQLLQRLVGMFTFGIYDVQTRELFCARDRLGIKPFYYVTAPYFAFASEIKALMEIPGVEKRVHTETLAMFLRFRVHDAEPQTFFAGVQRLMPGHYVWLREGQTPAPVRYWSLEANPEFASAKSDQAYSDEYYDVFERVMHRHLIADVPLGFNLSGGLDSSGVVGVAAELIKKGDDTHTGGKMFTFSALFPNETIDESRYITAVEKFAGSTPVYSYPKPGEFWDEIMPWVHTQEEPTISSAPYAYYSVFREASKHVKVSLSGNGGDETLAGYLPYFRTYLHSAVDTRHYTDAVSELVRGIPIFYKQYRRRIEDMLHKPVSVDQFLGERMTEYKQVKFAYSRNLNERLAQDVTKYSTPNLLRYEDKNSMAFSLESRVPFLDHELVEHVFSLPIDQKIKHGWTRFVYRNAMKGHMPELNRLRRSKIGFTNPEVGWMQTNAQGIREVFASPELAAGGLFDQRELLASFDRWLVDPNKEWVDPLAYWRILVSQLWIQRFELSTEGN